MPRRMAESSSMTKTRCGSFMGLFEAIIPFAGLFADGADHDRVERIGGRGWLFLLSEVTRPFAIETRDLLLQFVALLRLGIQIRLLLRDRHLLHVVGQVGGLKFVQLHFSFAPGIDQVPGIVAILAGSLEQRSLHGAALRGEGGGIGVLAGLPRKVERAAGAITN